MMLLDAVVQSGSYITAQKQSKLPGLAGWLAGSFFLFISLSPPNYHVAALTFRDVLLGPRDPLSVEIP